VRAGYCVGLAALLVVIGCKGLQNATANGDTRSLSFHNTHTKENLTVAYKVNGRYDEEALKRINHILRDWREDKPIRMDPHLLDLIWDVYREVEATQPISIICGYRSPDTNAMLRRRSRGVAKFSQHMAGKALDFYIPGVPLERLREAGLRASRGGVGFYPSSHFVHMDTGSVRHWPRMPEEQLARVMAKGPLTSVASRKQETKTASAQFPNPFAKLLGGGQEDDDHEAPTSARPAVAAAAPAKSAPRTEKTTVAAVPTPVARPAAGPAAEPAGFDLASASSRPVEMRPTQAASLVNRGNSANTVINERGFWQGLPQPEAASVAAKTSAAARRPAGTTVADAASTGSIGPWPAPDRGPSGGALAYAPVTHPVAPSRPSAATATRPTTPAAQRDTTVAVKRTGNQPTLVTSPIEPAPAPVAQTGPAKPGQRFNDPWLRAMIVAPSAGGFMSTSLLGASDYRTLSPYLHKPQSAVMMTFTQDPHLGMTTNRFAGTAVVFVSTVTFNQRTASLR
jgi:uncharacterized protein YcbK (DUF882 family)